MVIFLLGEIIKVDIKYMRHNKKIPLKRPTFIVADSGQREVLLIPMRTKKTKSCTFRIINNDFLYGGLEHDSHLCFRYTHFVKKNKIKLCNKVGRLKPEITKKIDNIVNQKIKNNELKYLWKYI
ncbi:MAG: hypothetical protein ABIB46_03950 [bacterium]